MRERATAVGGHLSAGARAEGGFVVSAELPLPPAKDAARRTGGAAAVERRTGEGAVADGVTGEARTGDAGSGEGAVADGRTGDGAAGGAT